MSETEPLLFHPDGQQGPSCLPNALGALAVMITMTLVGVYYLIPHYIQLGLDKGCGNYSLHSLQITHFKKNTIYFRANASLLLDQKSPISLETTENKLNLKISTNASNQNYILDLGIPHFFISAESVELNWDNKIILKDLSSISALISNILSDTLKKYYATVSYHPKFSIPGLPGSWKLLFSQTFDFIAKSILDNSKKRSGVLFRHGQIIKLLCKVTAGKW